MSDHLTRLVELTLGLAPTVRPRTFSAPEIFVPDHRVVVEAGGDGPALGEPETREPRHETAPAQSPDGTGDETSLAGSAAPPPSGASHPVPRNDGTTPGRASQAGDPHTSREFRVRAETPPTGEEPSPARLVPADEAHRPSGPAPDVVPLDPPGYHDEGSLTEPSVSGGRASAPVETRAVPEPPGETRPGRRDDPVREQGAEPGPARSGGTPPEDGSPGRGRSSGAATVGASGGRERHSGPPDTSEHARPDRLVERTARASVVGGSVRRDGAGGSSGAPPAVRITIGRVEARAVPPAAAPARPGTRASGVSDEKRGPALSLEDYLKNRGGRR